MSETPVKMAEAYRPETDQASTVTSFIALPTIFTPPSICSSIYRLNGFSLVAYDPGFGIDIDSRVRCAPPAVTTWWEQGRLGINGGEGHTAVSIGPLNCPHRWNTVVTSVKNKISTLAMCCPPDYTLANGISGSIAGDCLSNVLSDAVITYASTPATNTRDWTIETTTVDSPIYVGAIAIVGWTLDTAASKTASASTVGLDETAAATTRPEQPDTTASAFPRETKTSEAFTTTTSPTPGTSPAPALSGLPLPTTIGIGVGTGVGVMVLTALVFLLWRRKRKQQRESEPPPTGELHTPMPLKPDKYLYVAKHHELYGQGHERHLGPAEMPVQQYFAELDASGRERM